MFCPITKNICTLVQLRDIPTAALSFELKATMCEEIEGTV